MRNTTNNNYQQRHKWLDSLLSLQGKLSRNELEGISSIKNFCQLEVDGWFKKISLNSLKTAACEAEPDQKAWTAMKTMRAQLFARHSPKSTRTTAPSMPPLTEQVRISLLESHILSMAYYDIYNFLNLLSEQNSDNAEQILASIKLKLKTSQSKYHSYLSNHQATSFASLTLIQGGKTNE